MQHGIEKMKMIVDTILVATYIIIDVVKNKNYVKAFELFAIFSDYRTLFEQLKEAWVEAKDLTSEESFDLSAYIKEKFDIENDTLEEKIEFFISAIPGLVSIALSIVELWKAMKAIITNDSSSTGTKIAAVIDMLGGLWDFVTGTIQFVRDLIEEFNDVFTEETDKGKFRIAVINKAPMPKSKAKAA